MKSFTMSMYATKEELYKAKAEYLEDELNKAITHISNIKLAYEDVGFTANALEKIDNAVTDATWFLEEHDEVISTDHNGPK